MASTYTMVAYGSQGSAVRQLQNELNKRGYSLDQDGIFGKKTRAAVRDYQKKNGLTMVDGIAGDETWGSLLSAPTAAEQAAQALGYRCIRMTDCLNCEAREAGFLAFQPQLAHFRA